MLIRHKFRLIVLLSLCTVMAFVVQYVLAEAELRAVFKNLKGLDASVGRTFELSLLSQETSRYPAESRPRMQWEACYHELTVHLAGIQLPREGEQEALRALDQSVQKMYAIFQSLKELPPVAAGAGYTPAQRIVVDRLALECRTILDKVVALQDLVRRNYAQQTRRSFWLSAALIGCTVVILLVIVILLSRNILRPLERLRNAADSVASGRQMDPLQYSGTDELGLLAASFNSMIERLKTTMISVELLNKEVQNRAAAEKKLLDYQQQLEGIVDERTQALKRARQAAISIMQDTQFQKEKAESLLKELKARDAELLLAKEAAEQANQAKSEFLANMSHEIRTPMNAVLGFAEILKGKERDPQKKRYIESIYSSGHALLSLINDVLDLSKIEAGKLEISYSAVNLKTLCDEMLMAFGQKAQDKGLELSVEMQDSVPTALVLDELRLRQILINLISNALKYTEQGSVAVVIRAVPTEPGSHSRVDLEMEVRDTGIGIPAGSLGRIFSAFAQAHKPMGEPGGTGLGLTISRRLAEMMNGTISVESEAGKGSVFRVRLCSVETAAGIPAKGSHPHKTEQVAFEPARLLIADDIDYNREILTVFLEDQPFEIFYAVDGQEAVAKVKERRPDLILLDMKMPVMDGYEASKRIKADETLKDIPIIAITASALKQDEERILRICDGYLRKPVSKKDLVGELMKYLPYTAGAAGGDEAQKGGQDFTPEEISRQVALLPEAWRERALELAAGCKYTELMAHLDEIRVDYPAAAKAVELDLRDFRFDSVTGRLAFKDK